ncbi:protein translocase subunit SecD [bacterium]|nr:protein translocase subunit SecD [bacterium]
MNKNSVIINVTVIAVITLAILYGFFGVSDANKLKLKLGLDLRSGTHIALKLKEVVDPETGEVTKIDKKVLDRSIQVFTKRLNSIGTSEILIAPAGEDRIIVEIPEMTDLEKAKSIVKKAGRLEFKEKIYNPATATSEYKTVMDGRYITKATVARAGVGDDAWCVDFTLNSKGAKLFGDITGRMVGQPLGIFFDGTMHSEPVVKTAITGGSGQITGSFTLKEADELSNILNAGALPVDVEILEAYTVSPTLGAESLHRSEIASIVGLAIVMIYMIVYYRIPGLCAAVALIIYAIWNLACMVIPGLEFVLTLPGIAGFVLAVGMAVDANVLQFERVKEELWAGKSVKSALDIGFKRALSSIIDGHVTTFLGALILFWFGASSIKGFGMTLMLGTIMSLVTAIWVTRQLLYLVTDFVKLDGHRSLFGE